MKTPSVLASRRGLWLFAFMLLAVASTTVDIRADKEGEEEKQEKQERKSESDRTASADSARYFQVRASSASGSRHLPAAARNSASTAAISTVRMKVA